MMKELKEKFDEPEKKLKAWLPENYITKSVFRVAVIIMLLVVLYGAYTIKFDFKNYYSVSCKATEPQPCLNPFYVCFHEENTTTNPSTLDLINDGMNLSKNPVINDNSILRTINNCDNLDKKSICEQGLCDTQYIEQGKTLGKPKPNLSYINWLCLGVIVLALIINHIVWMIRK